MSFFSKLSLVFRKYPFFRTALVLLLIASSFVVSIILTKNEKKTPEILSMEPSTAIPGEVVTIYGNNFGEVRNTSYAEINGSKLMSSSYLFWSNEAIKIQIPQNVSDGLVYVVTDGGKSNARIFTNKIDIPVLVKSDPQTSTPIINSINDTSVKIGQTVTITGKNFGLLRGTSQVYFPSTVMNSKSDDIENFIPCSDSNSDYEFWSEQEIRVKVPDGTKDGKIFILTDKGQSNKLNITVDKTIGSKEYVDKRIYLLEINADISDIITTDNGEYSSITMRVPKPPVTPTQRSVEVTVSYPEPIIPEYAGTIVHLFHTKKNNQNKLDLKHDFVVQTYGINTNINVNKITDLSEDSKQMLAKYLYPDEIIQSGNEHIIKLAKEIVGKEKNPYNKAKKIYNYMLSNYSLVKHPQSSEILPIDLIINKTGDAYDFAYIFTALCRVVGVPCIFNAGVLIDANQNSKSHWWNEIYFEKIGWIPVDIAIASGLDFLPYRNQSHNADYYFGNLDSQHVVFSRGYNNLKSANSNSKTVYRPKTYALQSIWEEASNEVQKYSSFWSDVLVLGIY